MSGKTLWVEIAKEYKKALENLVGVIEAHELTSLSCDRDGQEFCDCLDLSVKQAKKVLTENS